MFVCPPYFDRVYLFPLLASSLIRWAGFMVPMRRASSVVKGCSFTSSSRRVDCERGFAILVVTTYAGLSTDTERRAIRA